MSCRLRGAKMAPHSAGRPWTVSRCGKTVALGAVIVLSLCASVDADDRPLSKGTRTRGLVGGWGHSWRPIFGQTRSQIAFVAFHPRMGWFVMDRLEMYGEATLFAYHEPQAEVAAGLGGLAGRYYLKARGGCRRWPTSAVSFPIRCRHEGIDGRHRQRDEGRDPWQADQRAGSHGRRRDRRNP